MTRTTLLLTLVAGAALASHAAGVRARQADERVTVLITLETPAAAAGALVEAARDARLATEGAAEADAARGRRTNELRARLDLTTAAARRRIEDAIRQRDGETVYSLPFPATVVARVPRSALDDLRTLPGVAAVEPDTRERAGLDLVASTMLTSAFWSRGFTGGASDVGVLDSGLYAGHAAFAPRAASIGWGVFHGGAQSQSDYCDDADAPTDFAGHGTLVGGVVFSQGDASYPAKRGIAYGIDRFYNLKAAYRSCSDRAYMMSSDRMAAVDAALTWADPPEVFNYSYGGSVSSDDDGGSRFWDAIVDGYQKVVAVAAGNSGPSAMTLNTPAIAYNVVSVANVQDMRTTNRNDDTIASSSSRGPTYGGRRKPDLAAPGSSIVLPAHTGTWRSGTGTSFAAPAVAGAAALLIDAGVSDPRAVKAVLINSADDYGAAGWDASYGWGYVNLSRAYSHAAHVSLAAVAPPLADGSVRYFVSGAATFVKVTAVWNRHAHYDIGGSQPPAAVLNNIDLALYASADGSARAASASALDNVEQVASSLVETTVLVVRSTGPFTGSSETVAIAPSAAFEERAGPGLTVTLAAPAIVGAGELFSAEATVRNPGDVRGHSYQVSLSLPPEYVLVSGANPRLVGSLSPGAQASVTWVVRAAFESEQTALLGVQAAATSYGSAWQASAQATTTTSGDCFPAMAISPRIFTWHGGEGAVDVSVAPGCGWTIQSDRPWISFPDGASGTGSSTVRFVVPAQSAVATRSASVTLGSLSWLVLQGGRPSVARRTDFDGTGRDHLTLFRPVSGEWLVEGGPSSLLGGIADRPVPGDYDGDGVADRATYRPSDSTWRVRRSSDNVLVTTIWGARGDMPVPADYNGDGVLELAVFRPSTVSWLIRGTGTIVYGAVGDVPIPGDYDGDGRSDIAVFRPGACAWFVRGMSGVVYGGIGDRPVPADYDGDGTIDLAVYRPATGRWFVRSGLTLLLGQPGDVAVPQDVDGDGRAEPTIFRPSTATWEGVNTGTGVTFSQSMGRTGDLVAAAPPAVPTTVASDMDGDRRADIAVFRPSDATWSTRRSGDLTVRTRYFGMAGDVPVPGDYLGTGTEQDAVYRPSNGAWFIDGRAAILFGGGRDDVPVPADYDGDGRLDLAVFRPSTARWNILTSASGFQVTISKLFGGPGDLPLPGDYDGDGRADVALFRDATVQWWVLRSSDGQVISSWFGNHGDRPMPADYDGDGRVDVAVYRPASGHWFMRHSSSGTVLALQFGGDPEDVPVALDYDGDGRANVAVYKSALWRLDVRNGFALPFGQTGDVPARAR